MATYLKYAYWLERPELDALKVEFRRRNLTAVQIRKAVCVPLSVKMRIGIVYPEAWQKTELCKRPLSWYWSSPRAGRYLLVSAVDLTPCGLEPQIVLRASSFKPQLMPSRTDKLRLISRPSYLVAKPPEWDNLEAEDPLKLQRWLRTMGIRNMTYKELFLTHCANHANFIEPEYYIEDNGHQVPYSIGSTREICSACLEFFNVIGQNFCRKLVVPCPGAVMFAGLPLNRYIAVETLSSK